MKTPSLFAFTLVATSACATIPTRPGDVATEPGVETTYDLVLASEVVWEDVNPARGDKSHRAGTLWGDRKGTVATGYLLRPTDGFESPPHIHNVSYRGVVIRGVIHNDDPAAERMWMPAGSFWTQPKGLVHITAARGADTLAYIEIEEGPYLVRPADQAFEGGGVALNLDKSNVVWLDAASVRWLAVPGGAAGAKVAFLWGDPQDDAPSGALIELPAGFSGTLRSHGKSFRAVTVQGAPQYRKPGATTATPLEAGSYFASTGAASHRLTCGPATACVFYARTEGPFDIQASREP